MVSLWERGKVWSSADSQSVHVHKPLGDNAVQWRQKLNVVDIFIHETSHTTCSAKTSLDKTVTFDIWWTSIISASLSTVYKIYKNSLKLCSSPLIKIIILLSACSVRSNTLEFDIPWNLWLKMGGLGFSMAIHMHEWPREQANLHVN